MATAELTVKDVWGALLARGIAAVLFGIAAVFWPGLTLVTLVYLFGAFVLVNGVITLVAGIMSHGEPFLTRLFVILVSLVELGVGVYLLRHPAVSFATLILVVGFVLIVHGVFDIIGGLFSNSHTDTHRVFNIIAGLAAIIVGVIVLLQPASAGVAFVWVLGLYALITGPLLIAMALDIKHSVE